MLSGLAITTCHIWVTNIHRPLYILKVGTVLTNKQIVPKLSTVETFLQVTVAPRERNMCST